jgi:hypothetical protein
MQRIIYIATRRKSAHLQDLFAAMREDMSSGSVELIIDRRYQDRRLRADDVPSERRNADRRLNREAAALQRNGWVRIIVATDDQSR